MTEPRRCHRCPGRMFADAAGDWSCLNCGATPRERVPACVLAEVASGRMKQIPAHRDGRLTGAKEHETRMTYRAALRARRRGAVGGTA